MNTQEFRAMIEAGADDMSRNKMPVWSEIKGTIIQPTKLSEMRNPIGKVLGRKFKGPKEHRNARTGEYFAVMPQGDEVTQLHAKLQRGLLAPKLPQYVQFETRFRKLLRKLRNPDTLPKLRKFWGWL